MKCSHCNQIIRKKQLNIPIEIPEPQLIVENNKEYYVSYLIGINGQLRKVKASFPISPKEAIKDYRQQLKKRQRYGTEDRNRRLLECLVAC